MTFLWYDTVNGVFEIFGGILIWFNVYQAFKDKQVHGVSVYPTCFFAIWGFWNIIFYYQVNCFLSLVGGIFLAIGTTIWCWLLLKYKGKENVD